MQLFLDALPDAVAEELLVQIAAQAMRAKLQLKRIQDGRGGWHTSRATDEDLRRLLVEHVTKGDPIDIMNFAAMLYVRQQLYKS